MWGHNIHGENDEEGLAALFHLGQDRCVQLNLEQACRELRVLVRDIQDKANAEAAKLTRGDQSEFERELECKLEKTRQWV